MKLLSLILLGALSGCATRSPQSFDYTVYVLRLDEQKLNAKDASGDLPISVCTDTPKSKANCYIFLKDEYIRLRKDLVDQAAPE